MRNKSVSTINGSTAFSSSFSFAHTVSVFFMGFFLTVSLFHARDTHAHTKLSTKIDFMDIEVAIGDSVVCCNALCDAKLFRFPSELMKNASLFSGKTKQF